MSVASLYADENFPRQVVDGLRRRGHDVLTCQEAGNAGRGVADDQVLAFATQAGRAVMTMDRRDFFRLHRQAPEHAGIIVCTSDADTERQAGRIHDAVVFEGTLAGKLVRVNRPQT